MCIHNIQFGSNIIPLYFNYETDVPQCTNTDNGALDYVDDSCVGWYNENPEDCGEYDDDDFKANEMCCACKTSGIPIPRN